MEADVWHFEDQFQMLINDMKQPEPSALLVRFQILPTIHEHATAAAHPVQKTKMSGAPQLGEAQQSQHQRERDI